MLLLRGRFATGVTVVTYRSDAALRGLTVASFATVSIQPPLVSVCIGKDLESHELLPAAGAFGVSILADAQEFLSERFAGRGPLVDGAFSGVPYFTKLTGAPLLEGAVAWLDCTVHATHDGGDHLIVVGRVRWADDTPRKPMPLIYFSRLYADLTNLRNP
jgi:flavin reductase (DIM6/NTAB) family NADH-FMN oxidoreductase RutF